MTDLEGASPLADKRPLILTADDDDEDILELVRSRLARCGYELVLARDGAEALRAARERKPDLALLDVSMPVMDGYEVTAALRLDPSTKGVTIILLTARAQPTDVSRGFEAGADDYVTKPFSPQELQARVGAALETATVRASQQPLFGSIRPVATQ